MAISREKKVEILNDLVSKFKDAKSIWFTSTNTITVGEFAELRKDLRKVDATYTLAKKTLIKKALKEALDIDVEIVDLGWQIWVICSNDDAIAGLGKVNDFMKKANWPKWDLWKITWSISIFDWEVKSADETKVLAAMPSRETLLGRLVGSMKSPISSLARFFDAASKELEAKWKTLVWELQWKVETPKEEVKTEATPETKIEEDKKEDNTLNTEAQATETPVEEVAESPAEETNVWEEKKDKAE